MAPMEIPGRLEEVRRGCRQVAGQSAFVRMAHERIPGYIAGLPMGPAGEAEHDLDCPTMAPMVRWIIDLSLRHVPLPSATMSPTGTLWASSPRLWHLHPHLPSDGYRSVRETGTAQLLEDPEEKRRGPAFTMKQYSPGHFSFQEKSVEATTKVQV